MWRVVILSLLAVVSVAAQDQGQTSIVRLDPKLDGIVLPGTKIERLADTPGPGTREGPIWIRNGGYLLYSDMPAKTIIKWTQDNTVATFLEHTDSDGVTLDDDGRIVWAADGQVVRLEQDGSRTVLASQYSGKPLNNPNDLVYKSDGSLYFTDPGHVKRDKDQNFTFPDVPSVYLLKQGELRLLTKDIVRPNGLAFSPDEKYLYLNDTLKMTITRYEVQPDDTIRNPKLVIDMNSGKGSCAYPCSLGYPDGMKVDKKGNIYCTGLGGVWIISASGKHLGTILIPDRPANLAFGDADGKSLFITSRPGLYRVRLVVSGSVPGP